MKELRHWLKEGDPVANEPPLSESDVQGMRRAITAAGDSHAVSFPDWARGSWAAATVVVAVTILVGMTRWFTPLPDVRNGDAGATPTSEPSQPARRQVELIAPGGTRVIWIFNADFQP
jgi:hypothetical protein